MEADDKPLELRETQNKNKGASSIQRLEFPLSVSFKAGFIYHYEATVDDICGLRCTVRRSAPEDQNNTAVTVCSHVSVTLLDAGPDVRLDTPL